MRTGEVRCPTCKAASAIRVHRIGFMQQNILGPMGIYPWKCGECGTLFLFRRRGQRVRRSRPAAGTDGEEYNRDRLT